MSKSELIRDIVERGATKKEAEAAVDAVFFAIGRSLKREGRFAFPNFGTFTVVERGARIGKNPHTGADVQIPARRVVKFRPAPALKRSL